MKNILGEITLFTMILLGAALHKMTKNFYMFKA